MLEVRAFAGTTEELSEFVLSAWKSCYAGAVAIPNWSASYFAWQLKTERQGYEHCIVAAYEGAELAGVLAYVPYAFELDGRPLLGAHASWLSVAPRFRRRGIAGLLQTAAVERSREHGIDFHVGFVFHGSRASIGPHFWLNSNSHDPKRHQTVGPNLGFWGRSLRGDKVASWSVNFGDRMLGRLSQWFVAEPEAAAGGTETIVRPFCRADAQQCVSLINKSTGNCDLRLLWDAASLTHHVTGFGKCLVAERNGIVEGFVAYHVLVFSGRTDESVGIIDLVSTSQMDRKSSGVCSNQCSAICINPERLLL